MALNPPISPQGLPLSVQGEEFILYRDHMEIEVKIPKFQKISGKGKLYLTSCRIVFVHQKFATDQFKSFDIPIANIRKEKFEQPVFGSNYLQGEVLPLHNLIPAPGVFKLWFLQGGTQRFLNCLSRILIDVKSNNYSFLNNVQTQEIRVQLSNQQSGYYDPSDPSIVYLKQPDTQYSSKGAFIGNDIYSINGESNQSFYFQTNDQNQQQNQQQRKEQPLNSGVFSQNQQSSTQYPPPPQQSKQSLEAPQKNLQAPGSTQYPPPPLQSPYPNQQFPNYSPSNQQGQPNQYYPPVNHTQYNPNPPYDPNNYPQTQNYPPPQNPYSQPPTFQNAYPQNSNQLNQNSGQTNQTQNQYYFGNWNQQNNKNM